MEKKLKKKCFPPGNTSKNLLRIKLLTFIMIGSLVTATAGIHPEKARRADQAEVPVAAEQQKREITGSVKENQGGLLPGVTVAVKGTTIGTTTNANGEFKLALPPDAKTLIFSFIGMQSLEIQLKGQTRIDAIMVEATINLDDVVVIGYGAVKKPDLTGSVAVVPVKDLVKAPVSSFAEALAGRVSGVRVVSSDGQPGAAVNIIIRGTGSLTQNTQPLYVIDGMAIEGFDPLTLNQEEIETMSILKDASSTAIYGARGANGVILIQTKRGSVGKPVVTLSSTVGFQQIPDSKELMGAYDFVKYQTELNPTVNTTLAYFTFDSKLGRQRTLEDYKSIQGVNFQDYLLRTGATQIHDVSLRGGTDKTKYSVSGSIYDLKGAIINSGLTRYTGRITLDQTISDKFSTGITVNNSVYSRNGQVVNEGQAGAAQPTSYLLISAWMYRPVTTSATQDLLEDPADSEVGTTSDIRVNPFLSQQNQHVINTTNLLETSGYIKYNISKDLVFKTTGGYRNNRYVAEAFYNSLTTQGSPYNLNNINGVNGNIANTVTTVITNSNTLVFNRKINEDHHIILLGLFETQRTKSASDGYTGRLLPNENLGISGIDEGTASNAIMSRSNSSMVSYAGRLDYNYKSRYLLTASYRADASSKFLDHWGFFPSASVAWNMQNEPIFKNLLPGVSNSKIRFGYGTVGNNRIGDFDYLPRLTFNNTTQGYAFNNSAPNGAIYMSNVGNSGLKWETVKTLDMGYELGVLKNKLTLEVDLYRKTTSDLLLNATLPPTTGFSTAVKNIGELRNDGLEITINSYNINTPKFKWQTNFNISFNRNKVMALTNGQQSLSSTVNYVSQFNKPLYIAEIGRPSGMMIGYIWEGNYQYADFDNPSPGIYILKPEISGNGSVRNTIQPGDIKYKDLNGDGTMTDADVTFIGRGQPIHTGGLSNNFSYKGFDLNVFFNWSYGNDIFNANRLIMEGNSNGWALINQYATYANRWSPGNPSDLYYRTRGQGPIGLFSSRTVEDGSFIKLKTVSLSYSVPNNIIKKVSMSNLTLTVSAQNLITWTNYTGLDPEVSTRGVVLTPGFDYSAYPRSPMIVFGLKAAF
jgi:TonB-linked SusC/RagA family outer membrane protein